MGNPFDKYIIIPSSIEQIALKEGKRKEQTSTTY